MRAHNLKPFVSNKLATSTKSLVYKPIKGGYTPRQGVLAIAYGFDAEAFPEVLNVYIEAKKASKLHKRQEHIADVAERLLEALPKIGMIALVDEATGYQAERPHDELQRILEAYVLPEHRPWMKVIPREFTKELYRVWGWNADSQRGPRYAGKLALESSSTNICRRQFYQNLTASNPPTRKPGSARHDIIPT